MRPLLRFVLSGSLLLGGVSLVAGPPVPPAHAIPPPPSPVIAPEVLRHGGTAGTAATVRWTAPQTGATPTTYIVAALPHDGDPTTTTPTATTTVAAGDRAPTASLSGLTPGVTYDITVTVIAASGSTTSVANPTTWLPSPADGSALWLDVSHPDTATPVSGQLTALVDRSDAGNDPIAATQPWADSGGYRGRAVTWGFPGQSNTDTGQGTITVANDASLAHQGAYTVLMALHQTSAVYPIYAQFMFKGDYLPQFGDCYPTQFQLAKFNDPAELYGYHGNDGNNCSSFVRQNRDGITATGDQVIGRRVRYDAGSGFSQSEFRRAAQWDTNASIAGRTPNANANLIMATPHMSETLLFTTALDDATVSAIEAYLAAKAPLPAPTVSAVTARADGVDVTFEPGHGAGVLAAGRYQVSLDGGTTWQERQEGYADSPLRVSGLSAGTTATVSVRAVSAAGYGTPSTPVTVTVPVPAPPPDVSGVLPLTTQPVVATTTTVPAPPATTTPVPATVPLTRDMLTTLAEGVLTAGLDVVAPGDVLTLQAGGFEPGEMVQAVIASEIQVLDTAVADADGAVTVTAQVPADLPAGQHTLALYAPVSGRGVRQVVTVTAEVTPVAPAAPDRLPATGTRPAPLTLALGLTMLIAGLMLAVSRSRAGRQASHPVAEC